MKLLEGLLYGVFWFVGWIIDITPFAVKRALARGLARVWFYVVGFRRRILLHNFSLVFPGHDQESMHAFRARCERMAVANLEHVILSFLEMLERFHWTADRLGKKIRIHGFERYKELLAQGRGFFFMTAHLGNWELITAVGKLDGIPLGILTKRLRNSFFDRIWVRSRRRFGLELFEESGSGLALVRAIRSGKVVGFIMDQHTGAPHGIDSEFLGLPAWCPKGLAILSDRLQAPILPAYILREDDGSTSVYIEPALAFPALEASRSSLRTESGQLSDAGLRYHIGICNESMKTWIFRNPTQYLWLHRRFKNFHDYASRLPWE